MKYFCAKIYLFAIKTLRCETRELLIFYRKGEEKSPIYTRGYKKGLVESTRHLYFRIYPFANIASLFLLSNNSYKNLKAARLRGSFREI